MRSAAEANKETQRIRELKYEKEIPDALREEIEVLTEDAIGRGDTEAIIEIPKFLGGVQLEWSVKLWLCALGYKVNIMERTVEGFSIKWIWEDD